MNELLNEDTINEYISAKWPNLTKTDLAQALALCKKYNLNPALNEVYIMKFGTQPALIVVNYQVILAKAKQSPKYYREELTYWLDNKELNHPHLTPMNCKGVVINVKIYDSENRIISSNDWDVEQNAESNKGSFKSTMFVSWAEKCALVNAFRRTFPNELQGLYIKEEFEADNETGEIKKPIKKHPKLADNFKQALKLLDDKSPDSAKNTKIIQDWAKSHDLTIDDMTSGNFDLEEFKKEVQ